MNFVEYFKDKKGVCKIAYKYGNTYNPGSHTACHSCLGDVPRGSTELLTSTWPFVGNPVKSRLFYDFVLDENKSPWRKVLKDFSVHDNYVHFRDLSKMNTQITDNLCIALRLPSERHMHFLFFIAMLDHFEPIDALYLAAQFRMDAENKKVLRSLCYGGHFAFDDHRELDYQAFVSGEPKATNNIMMNECAYTGPINAIWHTEKGSVPKIYKALAGDTYNGKFGTYRDRNTPDKPFSMSVDKFVEQVKKLDKATQW